MSFPRPRLSHVSGFGILTLTDSIRCNILIIILVLGLSLWFRICNKQADRGKRVIEGDVAFRYTI